MTKGLYALVQSKPAITAVISNRFYPAILPQGLSEFPASTYRWYNNLDNPTLNAPSHHDFALVDLQCYGRSYGDVVELWSLLREELEGAEGTYNTITITGVSYRASGSEDYLTDLELYTKQLELMISYYNHNLTT